MNMSKIYDELVDLIEGQQKGKENTDIFMVGEQLKEMGEESDRNAEILLQDIAMKEMDLVAAAGKLREYADKNHKSAKCFCITPIVADRILREFYGIAKEADRVAKASPATENFIDLCDFL